MSIRPVIIRTDFPGGNVQIAAISGNQIELEIDLRDTEGFWFYWCFEAVFPAAGSYTFRFTARPVVGARGPAYSKDDGVTWAWLGPVDGDDAQFTYECTNPETVRFCTGMQYLESDLNRFLAEVPAVTATELCRSNGGRGVELLTVGNLSAQHQILLTSRHHCCEMMATHVLEGILRTAASDPARFAGICFHAVPFMDKDGVEQGDQGKNRRPHDHARDYGPAPVYAETAAVMRLLDHISPEVVLDLHCPWLRGPQSEMFHFVGQPAPHLEQVMDEWSEILVRLKPAEIPYSPADNVRFGTAWNTDANFTKGDSLARYAARLPGVRAAQTLEIPYSNAHHFTLERSHALRWGEALAMMLLEWLG